MEKINYREHEPDLIDKLLRFLDSRHTVRLTPKHIETVIEPAKCEQLEKLAKIGIRPKWRVTELDANEIIINHKLIIETIKRSYRFKSCD